jgi:hypothetical protein
VSEREVSVKEALLDIASGMDHAAMMQKFRLSPEGLTDLFSELSKAGLFERIGERYIIPKKRQIDTTQLVQDISSGTTDRQLMEKYRLSSRKLLKVLRKLMAAGKINEEQFCQRDYLFSASPSRNQCRRSPRFYATFEIEIRERGNPNATGTILDITECGLAVEGIPAQVGETKTFRINGNDYYDHEPFTVEATCRWVESPPDGSGIAGFSLEPLAGDDQRALREFIEILTIGP